MKEEEKIDHESQQKVGIEIGCTIPKFICWLSLVGIIIVGVLALSNFADEEKGRLVQGWEDCEYDRDTAWKIFQHAMDLNNDNAISEDECTLAEIKYSYAEKPMLALYGIDGVQAYCHNWFFKHCGDRFSEYITKESMHAWRISCLPMCKDVQHWAKYFRAEHLLIPKEKKEQPFVCLP